MAVLAKPALTYALNGYSMKSSSLEIPMFFVDVIVIMSFISVIIRSVLKILEGYPEALKTSNDNAKGEV